MKLICSPCRASPLRGTSAIGPSRRNGPPRLPLSLSEGVLARVIMINVLEKPFYLALEGSAEE